MRRTLTTIVVLLIVWAIVNLAIAWLIALTESEAPAGRVLSDLSQWSVGDNRMTGTVVKIPGAENLQMTCWPQKYTSGPQWGTLAQFIDGLPTWQRSEMLAWCGSVEKPDPASASIEVFASGWPLVSFYVVQERQLRGGATVRGGWSMAGTRPQDIRMFPWIPIWRGFAVNSAMYAAFVFGFLLTCKVTRQWNRYLRGRCPRSAYDLRGNFAAGCTECGWRRDAVVSSPSTPSANDE